MQNGQSATEWMGEDGAAVMNIYRSEREDNIEKVSTNNTSTTDNGPNSGDAMEGEDLYNSAMSPDDDYTTSYEEQTEWATTATDTGVNVDNGTKEDKENNTTVSPNEEAVINNEEE